MTDSSTDPAQVPAEARILVAEDDADIRLLLVTRLARAGYAPLEAADGDEALERVWRERPDLVISDIGMPGRNGLELCRAVQELGRGAPPIMFLTASAEVASRVAGLESGAVDYVVKPFDVDELLARVRAVLRTKARQDELAHEAATDGLTGLLDRREFDRRVAHAFAVAERYGRPLSCVLIDVDHFKEINDSLGHAAGDEALRVVARRLLASSRRSDIVARFGGDEFALALPETDLATAALVARKLLALVAGEPVPWRGNGAAAVAIALSVSVGVAAHAPGVGDAGTVLVAADAALYEAKRAGRNRLRVAGDTKSTSA